MYLQSFSGWRNALVIGEEILSHQELLYCELLSSIQPPRTPCIYEFTLIKRDYVFNDTMFDTML